MKIMIISTLLMGILGILIGLVLGFFSKIFYVEVDENIKKIRDILPGNNCGGCGYAGCDNLAEAIAKNEADVNACPVGGVEVANKISKLLGKESKETDKKVAFVSCDGNCKNVSKIYNYNGPMSCKMISKMPNENDKRCRYACIGCGDCMSVCAFGAIKITDGAAEIDKEKCVFCKKCIEACPKHVINEVFYERSVRVKCSSKDIGKVAKDVCSVSCIACKICEKNCPEGAIKVEDNVSHIDYKKCTGCRICVEKCPRKCIVVEGA